MTRTSNLVIGYLVLAFVAGIILYLAYAIQCPTCSGIAAQVRTQVAVVFPSQTPTATPAPSPTPGPTPTATVAPVSLYVYGGYRYFADADIQSILRGQYHLDVKGEFKKGTFDMADSYDPAKQPVDCIFPGSKIGIEYFNQLHPKVIGKSAVAAQDRFVIFTWQELLPELEQAGLVRSEGSSWYVNMKPLVDALIAGKKWSEIGVSLPGYVRVEFTDPSSSSTGLQWMAFMGAYLVPGNEAGERNLTLADLQADPTILRRLYQFWENQGAQIGTTSNLFAKFVATGKGMPMMVAYESSFTDWYMTLPEDQKPTASKIVGAYPAITIGVEHTLASLTSACNPLLDAITTDAKIQQLAQDNHGLHPQGLMPQCPQVAPWCIPQPAVIPEPKKEVTDAIKACVITLTTDSELCPEELTWMR